LFEYEWLTGTTMIAQNEIDLAITLKEDMGNIYERSEFAFWLSKARKQKLTLNDMYDGYRVDSSRTVWNSANLWKQLGCPYEHALILFEGNDDNKKQAIEIMRKLGAEAIYEKMKFEMRASGIKNIPRGIRKSTQSNPANLTDRELGILRLLKEGLHNKEIGARLFISPKTVAHHISSIFFKRTLRLSSKIF
jgi:DNA-binding CsgD family transcriptional regulator